MSDWQNIWQSQKQQTRRPGHLEERPGVTYPTGVPCLQGHFFSSPFLTPPQAMQVASKKVIVIVDDSITVRKILETCLGRAGFEVKTFEDGLAFFRWLATPEACIPDLLFLDLVLPKMDGYDIAQRLKANPLFQETVLLFLSQKDSVLDRLKGRLVGARGYLTKPFLTEDILAVATSMLGLAQPGEH